MSSEQEMIRERRYAAVIFAGRKESDMGVARRVISIADIEILMVELMYQDEIRELKEQLLKERKI